MMPTVRGPVVQERTIHPLGLEISGRRFMEVIAAGVDIPKEGLTIDAPELLTTNMDNLSSMAIVVYENTMPKKSQSTNQAGMKRLAGTSLRNIPPAPQGKEQVKVTFSVGQDNILKVTAKSLSTDGAQTELAVDELYS